MHSHKLTYCDCTYKCTPQNPKALSNKQKAGFDPVPFNSTKTKENNDTSVHRIPQKRSWQLQSLHIDYCEIIPKETLILELTYTTPIMVFLSTHL